MDFLTALWVPILLSAGLLFFVSAIAWMALPHHRDDYRKLPDEDALMGHVRQLKIPAGRYSFPHFGSNQNSKDPELQRKLQEGPMGLLTVMGPMTMGQNMLKTLVYFLLTSSLLAYLAWITVGTETAPTFARVFRVVGTAAVLTYTCSAVPNDIWFKRPLWTNLLDGVVYGLITGALFAALWP